MQSAQISRTSADQIFNMHGMKPNLFDLSADFSTKSFIQKGDEMSS